MIVDIVNYKIVVKHEDRASFIQDKVDSIFTLATLSELSPYIKGTYFQVELLISELLCLKFNINEKRELQNIGLIYRNSNGLLRIIETPHKKLKYILNKAEYLIKRAN